MISKCAALHLVYLVSGVEQVTVLHRVTCRLKGADVDHPITAGGGHIGMVEELLPYAQQIADYIAGVPEDQEWPGVFEYQVTESLGAWLAANWESAGPVAFGEELTKQASAFFSD